MYTGIPGAMGRCVNCYVPVTEYKAIIRNLRPEGTSDLVQITSKIT